MGEIEKGILPEDSSAQNNSSGTSQSIEDLSGQQIGRYLIGQLLGRGGIAAVYQAYDQVQGQSVALKVLPPTADEKTLSRFRREAMTSGSLRHPHIVRTMQVGIAPHGDVAYIAMELIEGETLASLLSRCRHLHPEESCNLLEPIANALAHAHQAGIVHRDVKPSNILLRPTSPGIANSIQLESLDHPVIPLLSDFGIALSLDAPELTGIGRTVGTPAYMSPEQCRADHEVDGRADVYSLGTVLYRCLVGHPPFMGSTTQILHAHVYEALSIEDDILRRIPPLVVEILQLSLAKSPSDRYVDAQQMASAMAVAAGRPPTRHETHVVGDSTGTLTLPSISTTPATLQPVSTTVLVPSPTGSPVDSKTDGLRRTVIAPPPKNKPVSPPLSQDERSIIGRLENFNWLGLALVSLSMLLVSVFTVTFISDLPALEQLAFGLLGRTATPVGAIVPAQSTQTDTPMPTETARALAPVLIPTYTPTSSPTVTEEPTSTLTPLPIPTSTPLPPTLTPQPTDTLVPTQTPTATETATPEVTSTLTPTPTPLIPVTPTWTPLAGAGTIPSVPAAQ